MSDPEFMKEYLREAFMSGALDLGVNRKYIEGFVRIFAGEMEALIAVEQAEYLSHSERVDLMNIAAPTKQSVNHMETWRGRIFGARRETGTG